MSAQEERQALIYENIPELIKSLTGFSENEENFNLCLEFAESKIATHRNLSVNSHEIRRRINGLAERFTIANYARYADRLKELCNNLITDPLCIEHYETDVQWSILHFLLEMSKNPVSALVANKDKIVLEDVEDDDEAIQRSERERCMADMIHSLVLVNENANVPVQFDESDLSEWSDEDAEDDQLTAEKMKNIADESPPESMQPPRPRPVKIVTELRPPQKPLCYTTYDAGDSRQWLESNVQHSWWLDSNYKTPVNSVFPSAHFNRIYGEFLERETNGAYKANNVFITHEWCLLREILWMFLKPARSHATPADKYAMKYFSLDTVTNEIKVNENVALSSASTQGTQAFLQGFAPYMTYAYRLRYFYNEIVCSDWDDGQEPPQTVQCYAVAINDFLHSFADVICEIEAEVKKRNMMDVYTVIRLFCELQPHVRMLQYLYEIHSYCYLDYRLYPAHITSMYLLATLKFKIETACNKQYLNMASSIFLVTVKYYYHVFRNMWNTGRMDDWLHEFLIERIDQSAVTENDANAYRAKSYDLQTIESRFNAATRPIFSSQEIKIRIKNCKFLNAITQNCLDAGYVLNIVCNLDKLPKMLTMFNENGMNKCLRTEFMEKLMADLDKWKFPLLPERQILKNKRKEAYEALSAGNTTAEEQRSLERSISGPSNECGPESGRLKRGKDNSILNPMDFLGDDNPLLFLVFEEAFKRSGLIEDEATVADEATRLPSTSFEMYQRFNKITDFLLPYIPVICKYTNEVLQSRISIANQYVLDIYLQEYDIMKHISNLRMVFLLGAGDLMLAFYSNLFQRMNNGENWYNPYLLTVQLEGILSMQYPEMSSMFRIQLKSANFKTKMPLDAIADITVIYNAKEMILDVIHANSLKKYNAVFRFLLKIKWAIWTLETQRFPVAFKNRRPYRQMNIYDLIFKRLAMIRNWIIYTIQTVHSHLMTFVIQSMGQQLPKKIRSSASLRELIKIHDFYIDTIYEFCFQTSRDRNLLLAIEQLIYLVVVVKDEWTSLEAIDPENNRLKMGSDFDIAEAMEHVDEMESAFIKCHCAIAEILSQEVYVNDREDLAALSAAFNCSMPC